MAVNALTATSLLAGFPVFGTPGYALTAQSLTVASPTLPTIVWGHALFALPLWLGMPTTGHEVVAPQQPLVWLANKARLDETAINYGNPLQEAIFGNLNDDVVLDVDSQTLVGRNAPGRGPAQRIALAAPLFLSADNKLSISPTGEQTPTEHMSSLAQSSAIGVMYYRSSINAWSQVGIGPGMVFSGGVLATQAAAAAFTTGDAKLTFKVIADPGWIMANDGSIGDAGSNATTRANDDCEPLFTLLYTNIPALILQSSTGTTVARGTSAAVDFGNHRRLVIPKALGRALALAGAGVGLTARVLGAADGVETITQSIAQMPQHDHTTSANVTGGGGSAHTVDNYVRDGGSVAVQEPTPGNAGTDVPRWNGVSNGVSLDLGGVGVSVDVNDRGSGQAMNIMNPRSYLNCMIKL